jgi:hypothetical protein
MMTATNLYKYTEEIELDIVRIRKARLEGLDPPPLSIAESIEPKNYLDVAKAMYPIGLMH